MKKRTLMLLTVVALMLTMSVSAAFASHGARHGGGSTGIIMTCPQGTTTGIGGRDFHGVGQAGGAGFGCGGSSSY